MSDSKRSYRSQAGRSHLGGCYTGLVTMDLAGKRIVVTGGAGFLGGSVCRKLRDRGCDSVFVPRSSEYDLTREQDVRKLYDDTRPEVVLHLAAEVGGIGANVDNPGRFFFANMGPRRRGGGSRTSAPGRAHSCHAW